MSIFNRIVVIEVSTICNLACPFCAHDRRRTVARHTLTPQVLQAFTSAIGQSAARTGEAVLISWLGGEPFLNQHIRPLTEALRSAYPLYFSATTNGTRLSDERLRQHIREHYAELTVSIDGFSAFHDPLRGLPGLFDDVKQQVQRLAAEAPGLKLRANCVLMRANFEQFTDLCVELAGWGIQEITFNQLGGRDRPEFYPENRPSVEQVARLPEMAAAIQQAIQPTGAQLVFSDSYYRRIQATAQGLKLPIRDCAPGRYYMFVNAQGQAAPCSFTTAEYGIDIASIRTAEDFEQLSAVFHQKKTDQQAHHCYDCPATNVHGKFS